MLVCFLCGALLAVGLAHYKSVLSSVLTVCNRQNPAYIDRRRDFQMSWSVASRRACARLCFACALLLRRSLPGLWGFVVALVTVVSSRLRF